MPEPFCRLSCVLRQHCQDSHSISYMCKPSIFPLRGLHCFLDVSPNRDVSPLYLRGVQPVLCSLVISGLSLDSHLATEILKVIPSMGYLSTFPPPLMLGRKAIATISLPSPLLGKRGLAIVDWNLSLALHKTLSTLNLNCAGLCYNSFFF